MKSSHLLVLGFLLIIISQAKAQEPGTTTGGWGSMNYTCTVGYTPYVIETTAGSSGGILPPVEKPLKL